MLNLAALRYRDVLAEFGGPIERLTAGEVSVVGQRWFECNAYLRADCASGRLARRVYGAADGTGTAASPLAARFKAISEAIERWAQMEVCARGEGAKFGFNLDPSSTGMAAFPGLFTRQARRAALMEAVERSNLMHWWEGRLRASAIASPWPEVRAVVIESELPGVTVVLYRRSPRGYTAYGHAAGATFRDACWRALVELERHDLVVRYYAMAHVGANAATSSDEMHPTEQRCLFFAFEEGRELFEERLRCRPVGRRAEPRLLFDGPVPGPWERYAGVWRVLFAPPSEAFKSTAANYFLW